MTTHGRRRALGQHFLIDPAITEAIADAALTEARLHRCTVMMEIGPGKGAITYPILERLQTQNEIRKFFVVERDKKLAENWQAVTVSDPSFPFSVEMSDFLELPREKWAQEGPLQVVSNLPYSAGTAILVRLAKEVSLIPSMVLMFQTEVANRLKALPSTKSRGSLSVWIQNRWDVRKLISVPPRAFRPPPDVNSEVVVLTRRAQPHIPFPSTPEMEDLWESVLKASFAQRRKMLRSTFPWQNALEVSGVDGTKRAEALDWPEWDRLFQAVVQCRK